MENDDTMKRVTMTELSKTIGQALNHLHEFYTVYVGNITHFNKLPAINRIISTIPTYRAMYVTASAKIKELRKHKNAA